MAYPSGLLVLLTFFFSLIALYRAEELQYCPFYNNRGTSPQPFLKNCTWYADNACCTQIEIDYAFANVKPPQGAPPECLRQLNYLMCYICDPLQYKFYKNEYLTVDLTFCDNLYDACKDAILKGSVIRNLYKNGEEFCTSRRFEVGRQEDAVQGFFYNNELDSSTGHMICLSYLLSIVTIVFALTSIYWPKNHLRRLIVICPDYTGSWHC